MGKKYDVRYDPYQAMYANQLAQQAQKISGLASQYDTNSALTGLGKSELDKITQGKWGDTLYAGVLRNQAARDIQSSKENAGLGTAAMRAGANNPNSLLSAARMQRRAETEIYKRNQDAVAQGMPAYLNAAGGWEQTSNNVLSQRIAAESGATSAIGGAAQAMAAGTTVTEKKGFWGSLMSGISSVAGIAGAFGLSDERTKEGKKAISGKEALKKTLATKTHKFKYKDEYAHEAGETPGEEKAEQSGVMADEVAEHSPEAVRTRPDGLKEVRYRDLFVNNIAATGEIARRVEKLERKMAKKS